jgi:glutamyl/glutaminyl-tRNA synthetase
MYEQTIPATQQPAYIGRLAPSPTGYLHLGHARTFWAAYQRALAHNGTLLLRNEDLDTQRSREHFAAAFREDLAWLRIVWTDEMRQSTRLLEYRAALDRLIAAGFAYPCTCSRKDLAQATQAPHEDSAAQQNDADDERIYKNRCRPATSAPARLQLDTNYRFRIRNDDPVRFNDLNAGAQSFTPGRDLGDFILWRKDGLPSYQLACVVDDAATAITEVVRGRDLLKSTARQILLQRALSLPTPTYFHCDVMRDADGVRLAKRHDALSLRTLRSRGLTPQQVQALF